ncbi:MAG: hypothetical protein ABFQ82_02790 [Thermodesulfobacteriota bacterium]
MDRQMPPQTVSPYMINMFFVVGLVAAFSFRILIVFSHSYQSLFRPVWYLGTIGYLFFFLYRFMISQKRKRAIEQYELIPKLRDAGPLSEVDREVVVYLLSSIRKSRENLNYLFIFGLSFLAIIADQLIISM